MQKMTKSTTTGILLLLALAGLLATTPLASAQSTNGSFNPQTEFPVGSTVTITSVNGLGGGGMPFFNSGMMSGVKGNWTGHAWGQNGNQTHSWGQNNQGNWTSHSWGQNGNQSSHTWGQNGNWNQAGTRNWNQTRRPSFNASLTLTAQVTNDTANGGILWTIQNGTIVENGTILTITSGRGGFGKLDRILMGGNVTAPNGNTYRWVLEGLAATYKGTVIASLNGFSGYNPNVAAATQTTTTTQQSSTGHHRGPRGVGLSFIATVT
ncbi:MAG TPA: hypothetical protein VJZ32_11880 [Candidatus Bathyarchaeia archaeon]|nr:hypothetical protein [Candidatus Bathyarchaeia archaeon]